LLEKLYTDPKRWSFQVILWLKYIVVLLCY
jgi:hypothetical protein